MSTAGKDLDHMRRTYSIAITIVVAVALTLATRADPIGAAQVPQCVIDVKASFGASASSGSRAVDVLVLPDCSAIVGQPRALTPLEAASVGSAPMVPQQRCSWANRMIGAGGEGDILTEVTINQTFAYDFVDVLSESHNGTTYNHWPSGWGVISSWIQNMSSTPTATYEVDGGASFSWFGPWHHDKTTHSFAHGAGDCTGDFWHTGAVCTGCNVRFYIFYL